MDALLFLNKASKDVCRYLPFNELEPGRYRIDEFFIKVDQKFNTVRRLCIKIANKSRYLILPKRFMDNDGEEPKLENLNKEAHDFIFVGKFGDYVLDFKFEAGKDDALTDVSYLSRQ